MDTLDTTNPPQGGFITQRENIRQNGIPILPERFNSISEPKHNIPILPERFNSISEPKLGWGNVISTGLEIW